jgi:hypothetical protein
MSSRLKEIQDAVNLYINTNFDDFKRKLPSHGGYAIDYTHIIYALKGVSVEFREDPYYSNKVVKDSDINIEHREGATNFKFTGIGNLTIRIDLNIHIESLEVTELILSAVVLNTLTYYLKFFGIKTNYAFFCSDSEIYFMDEIVGGEDLFSYENYPWEDIEKDKNPYWKVVESLQESITTNLNLIGRDVVINNDGTVSVEDKSGRMVKVRMSVKLLGNINVSKITQEIQDFYITGRSGRTEKVSMDTIKDVISFVDTGKPTEIESGNPFKPNIQLTKV